MNEAEAGHLPVTLELRQCSKCGCSKMRSDSRDIEGFATANHFICPDCGHETKIASPGSSGFYLAIGLVATAAIVAVMASSKGLSQGEGIFAAVLFAFFTTPSMLEIVTRWRHPVTGRREASATEVNDQMEAPADPLQKGITWLDAFGFLKTFLGVFVFIALWLVFWGAVGLIGDAFF